MYTLHLHYYPDEGRGKDFTETVQASRVPQIGSTLRSDSISGDWTATSVQQYVSDGLLHDDVHITLAEGESLDGACCRSCRRMGN